MTIATAESRSCVDTQHLPGEQVIIAMFDFFFQINLANLGFRFFLSHVAKVPGLGNFPAQHNAHMTTEKENLEIFEPKMK